MTNDSLIECIKQLEAINYEIGFADSTLVIEGAPTSMAKQREICRKNLKLAIEQHQVEQPKVSNSTGLELLIDQLRAESDIWHGIIPCCRAEAIIRKHYEGHPAVEGKPLELMTRDELLAYIKANETGDNFNAEPKLNVSCSNEDIVKKLIVLPTYGKIIGTAFGTMICLEEAIAAMGTETAVNASKEQEEFGIAPEAAGLEPECDQPVPANMGEESIRKDEAPAMDALADGLSPSPAHSSGYPDNGLSLREKAMSVKSFFDSPKSYSDEEYAFVVENANLLWKHLGNAPNPVRSGEMRLLSEQERYESLKNLTQHLPDLPDNTTMPWIWSEEEIAMLRAACAKRFDESLRTESLFCIAMTGIRIFLSRAKPEPVMSEPVSLIKCAMALQGNQRIKLGSDLQAIAKAVLDASGVQYAD